MFRSQADLFQKEPPQLPGAHSGIEGQLIHAHLPASGYDRGCHPLDHTMLGKYAQSVCEEADAFNGRPGIR